MEKKVRITLFDKEGRISDEKWVNQNSEFYGGPKEVHDGPFRIEFTFMDQSDVDKIIKYISQLIGSLPLPEARGRKSENNEPLEPAQRQVIIDSVLNEAEDQDQLIKLLREQGFVFLTWDHLETLEYSENIKMKDGHKDYQWMIKRLKIAKNPLVDKYDPMLLFGIVLMGERTEKVIVYLNGEFQKSVKVPLPEKPRETVKKTEMMKFPSAMIQDERDKFRYELRQLQLNPEREITRFFKRWRPFVENVPAISQDKKEQD
jgi:hypothetical protein